jgi:transcriptional regulator with XRE-family HTH domain
MTARRLGQQRPPPGRPTSRHPIDVHVGAVIRQRRHELGQTQTGLAEALEVSFQQVQKYERGANRVSASTLYRLAQAQGVRADHYFRGLPTVPDAGPDDGTCAIGAWLASRQAWAFGEAILAVPGPARAALLQLVRALKG